MTYPRTRADLSTYCMHAVDWLLPTVCLLCGERNGQVENLCAGCAGELPQLGPACRVCASPNRRGERCHRCHRRPPPLSGTVAALRYESPVDYLVGQLKFRGRTSAARPLGQLLAAKLAEQAAAAPRLVLPVPLHARRRRERGFNQASEITRALCSRWSLEWREDLVERVRDTPPQSGLSQARARRENIKGAFRAASSLNGGHHVAIVDDVMTTGATVFELARCLLAVGVGRVDAWVVARAPEAMRPG